MAPHGGRSRLQIAFTDAIRIDDIVVVQALTGRIEEITLTYVAPEEASPLVAPMLPDPAFHDRDNFAGEFAGKHEVPSSR